MRVLSVAACLPKHYTQVYTLLEGNQHLIKYSCKSKQIATRMLVKKHIYDKIRLHIIHKIQYKPNGETETGIIVILRSLSSHCEGVEVKSHRAREEERCLRHDGHPAT